MNMGKSSNKMPLFILIIMLIILAILIMPFIGEIYLISSPQPGKAFTEFQILGPDGKADNYPTNLAAGESGNLIISIINHESTDTTYKLIVKLNQNILKNEKITLANSEKKEISFTFKPSTAGNNQKLEFLLYKLPDAENVYRSNYMNLNIV